MATTLKHVAERAQVSTATASMVLSGKVNSRVSDATAERVRRAAADLDYRGNRAARSLRLRTSAVVGMVGLGVATKPFAVRLLLGAQLTARQFDHDLMYIEIPDEDDAAISANLRLLEEHQVSGVLIASYFHRSVALPAELPERLVLLDATSDRIDVDSVVPDEYVSERLVLAELSRAGHRRVGWICDESPYPATHMRTRAFHDVALEQGWDDSPRREVYVTGSNARGGYEAMTRMLVQYPEVTAVACFTDRMAMGAYMACYERQLRIPQDVSIVGFDDQRLVSDALRPGLTTIDLPHQAMGEWGVRRLMNRIKTSEPLEAEHQLMVGHAVVRGSVGAPRAGQLLAAAGR